MRRVIPTLAVLILFFAFLSAGCTAEQETPDPVGEGTGITIHGLTAAEASLSLEEIKALPSVSGEAVGLDSAGKEVVLSYEGAELGSILEKFGASKQDYEGIRLTAGDGYSVEVPADVLHNRQIILAYLINGEAPREGAMRVVVPGERAMYWVKAIKDIHLLTAAKIEPVETLAFAEDILSALPADIVKQDESGEKAVNIKDILGIDRGTRVFLLAADGLFKGEMLAIDEYDYLIRLTGEESPLFYSPELPQGMQVKNLAVIFFDKRGMVFLSAFASSQVTGEELLALLEGYLAEGELVLSLSSGDTALSREDFAAKTFTLTGDGMVMVMD